MTKQVSWGGAERRSSQRFPLCVRVELKATMLVGNRPVESGYYFTRDVSSTGLFLLCEKLPPIGTFLQITIALPGVRPLILVQGKVVRQVATGEKGVGVEFVEMPSESKMLLEEQLPILVAGIQK